MTFRQRRALRAALREHFTATWPESVERGVEIHGVEPVMADADIYGWAVASLHGDLTQGDRARLLSVADQVEGMLPALPENARGYFERLVNLARIAVEFHHS